MNMVLVIYFAIGSLVGLVCVIAFWFVVYWLKYRLWLRKFEKTQRQWTAQPEHADCQSALADIPIDDVAAFPGLNLTDEQMRIVDDDMRAGRLVSGSYASWQDYITAHGHDDAPPYRTPLTPVVRIFRW